MEECVVVLIEERMIRAFRRQDGAYVDAQLDAGGIWRSRVFPGLWLDVPALFKRDAAQLLATLHNGLATDEHRDFVARLQSQRS